MKILDESGEYELVLDNPDSTKRTCTRRDRGTEVNVDFVKGGIRICDGRWINGTKYSDPIPLPNPTGVGDVASLETLIAMKLNSAISGEDTLKLGANTGGRNIDEIQKDLSDVRDLITFNHLGRRRKLGNKQIQCRYEKLIDENDNLPTTENE